jgi:hypothetical protein
MKGRSEEEAASEEGRNEVVREGMKERESERNEGRSEEEEQEARK